MQDKLSVRELVNSSLLCVLCVSLSRDQRDMAKPTASVTTPRRKITCHRTSKSQLVPHQKMWFRLSGVTFALDFR